MTQAERETQPQGELRQEAGCSRKDCYSRTERYCHQGGPQLEGELGDNRKNAYSHKEGDSWKDHRSP